MRSEQPRRTSSKIAARNGGGRSLFDDHRPTPDELPDLYACICTGDCLEPELHDSKALVFDKLSPVRPGDFVILHFKPDRVPPGELPALVKRLAFPLPPELGRDRGPRDEVEFVVLVETLNPPRRMHCRAGDLLAVHRCVGEAETTDDGQAVMPMEKVMEARAEA